MTDFRTFHHSRACISIQIPCKLHQPPPTGPVPSLLQTCVQSPVPSSRSEPPGVYLWRVYTLYCVEFISTAPAPAQPVLIYRYGPASVSILQRMHQPACSAHRLLQPTLCSSSRLHAAAYILASMLQHPASVVHTPASAFASGSNSAR